MIIVLDQSVSKDMEASFVDSGLVIDSKEGVLEESEEVEDRSGEEGQDLCFSGTPSPNI